MTTPRDYMGIALKTYGEAAVAYAAAVGTDDASSTFDNMVFWQNQLWHCAKAVAQADYYIALDAANKE